MNTIYKFSHICLLAVAAISMPGCESLQKITAPLKPAVKPKEVKPAPQAVATPPESPAAVPPPASNGDAIALKEGLSLYNDGDYNGAIKKLSGSTDIWSGHNKAIQLNALKTMAFSYCVTSRTQLCRQQFERALKLDPSFDLLPSEIGHPIWGPVFLKAKKAK
ncbi:TssQ family T6SS-associated lipoprotein [Undibacterium sp. Jales W-56]|uniref:TssQ family T6SS-associated lipoprotein n=1 Tax=Undibacterium sp. Jales W-56 TaxID=2897325 RepID=UPI0021CED92D|nr:TssQ family T6SS-associated lipoprotein [Undibacterium sp. Jales W-56]MCU6432795.1 TssQ family T6SS-associated lipoprotein [Undibacterium sp. Jales W-56]